MHSTAESLALAIDQGTSSTKSVLLNSQGDVVRRFTRPISVSFPRAGWVEQDAMEILASVEECLTHFDAGALDIAALGFSTQRESALVWERSSGAPVGPMLSWQDRRTTVRAAELADAAANVRRITGLPLDPMFSALKIEWILNQVDPDRRRSRNGELAVGTVDSWLVYSLTGHHRIELGNASRTGLLNITSREWDPDLLQMYRIPLAALPRITSSVEPGAKLLNPRSGITDVHAVLADSHAALYGHGVRMPGRVKATFGTGSSVMGLADSAAPIDLSLCRTIAWQIDGTSYAFEGNILSSGATFQWLADLLDVQASDVFALADSATESGGVDIVPAFAGLGAPWWDEQAQGTISGLTLGTERHQLAKAALDSMALQVYDVVEAVVSNGVDVRSICIDGGPSNNPRLVQSAADYMQRPMLRSDAAELSAAGAAALAGTVAGLWADRQHQQESLHTQFDAKMAAPEAGKRVDQWHLAVDRARLQRPSVRTQQHPPPARLEQPQYL